MIAIGIIFLILYGFTSLCVIGTLTNINLQIQRHNDIMEDSEDER